MRSRFDAFGKNVLRDTLARVGGAEPASACLASTTSGSLSAEALAAWLADPATR